LRDEDAVTVACRCQFCHDKLEPAQELRFLVEVQNLDDPATLDRIRQLPAVNGKPLRVCKGCQAGIEKDPAGFRAAVERARRRPLRTGVLAAVGLLSVGWLLGTFLAPQA
jgi:hypothetical protein